MVDRDLLRQTQERDQLRVPEHRRLCTDEGGGAFVMMLAGRIDFKILKDAKKFKMTRKELVSFMKFLKLTNDGEGCRIHNQKKRHAEVAEQLGLSFDTSVKCLG